ncbi:MAG: L-seryl-tRNA(Sec) selenium transferase [Defluviitaleaceae bacterium]|nr:L-seryl-tRNA(Sec) selenium transferase [Defluviitaleaceae bacterium]
MDKNILLRQIPKVDEILAHPLLSQIPPGALLTNAVRCVLDEIRGCIHHGSIDNPPNCEIVAQDVASHYYQSIKPNLQRVINGTGIILHTNLGRAPLANEALAAIQENARDYSNLEYDIPKGKRSSRYAHIEDLLAQLTGAEAAMVVNNNAAAILLALSAVAHNKDVIVSRGELVEIGGSFRVPDVLEQSGCRLVEVGTTNKTHGYDYENAISKDSGITGALLRVHTSNFIMSGFVAKPTLEELSAIAVKYAVPLIEDLGSGCIIRGIHGQPVVADSIKAGVDIVTFSGDKLLGGPQAGIVTGRKEYIDKMKKHPLARALRIDKLCLAALEATLRLYLAPDTVIKKIPTLRMLCEDIKTLEKKAELLRNMLIIECANVNLEIKVITETSKAGGGAMPEEDFTTAAVAIITNLPAQALEHHFRMGDVPIIGRISHGQFILDVRTLDAADFPIIASRFQEA